MYRPEPTAWQKSSFSPDGNNCLELGPGQGSMLHLRESDEAAIVLATSPARLRALLNLARSITFPS